MQIMQELRGLRTNYAQITHIMQTLHTNYAYIMQIMQKLRDNYACVCKPHNLLYYAPPTGTLLRPVTRRMLKDALGRPCESSESGSQTPSVADCG